MQRINNLRSAARVALEEEGELDDDDNRPEHKPGPSKKKKDSDDEGNSDRAALSRNASRNQMAMDAFNTLMSVLTSK